MSLYKGKRGLRSVETPSLGQRKGRFHSIIHVAAKRMESIHFRQMAKLNPKTDWYQIKSSPWGLGVYQQTSGALVDASSSVTKKCLETYLEDTEIIDFQHCCKLSSSRNMYGGRECGEKHHTTRGCSLNQLHQLKADPLFNIELDILTTF